MWGAQVGVISMFSVLEQHFPRPLSILVEFSQSRPPMQFILEDGTDEAGATSACSTNSIATLALGHNPGQW